MRSCWQCEHAASKVSDFCSECGARLAFGENFTVQRKLGEGGFGAVFLADDVALSRSVAIKVLSDPGLSHAAKLAEEAKMLASLKHPNIVEVHSFHQGSEPYIVMEYMSGGSLRAFISASPAKIAQRVPRILDALCNAVAYAHERKIWHRDLKPENILLNESESVKLSDFGIAKLAATLMPHKLTAIGTPHYMAPEVFHGQYDCRCDLYSLGVVAYELLCGCRPYEGRTPVEIYRAALSGNAKPPSEVNSKVSSAVSAIVMRLLDPKPENRYADATMAGHALRIAFKEYEPIRPLDEFQRQLTGIYAGLNSKRGPENVLAQNVIHASTVLRLAHDQVAPTLAANALTQLAAWLLSYTSMFPINASKAISGKYRDCCPSCRQATCACEGNFPDGKVEWSESNKVLVTIREYQQLFETLYQPQLKKGIGPVAIRLVVEVAELVEVHNKLPDSHPQRRAQVLSELADCYAWLFLAASTLGVDLEQSLNDAYPGICRRCEQTTCQCAILSARLTHKYPWLSE